jgi:hypothetical protein
MADVTSATALFPAWETWKHDALSDIDPDRTDTWRTRLSGAQAADIAALCRPGMVRLGYPVSTSATRAALRRWSLPPSVQLRLVRANLSRRRQQAAIGRMAHLLSPPDPRTP